VDEKALLAAFKKHSGYAFKNGDLLIRALTHSSQALGPDQHNERLEFLGDRVLALVIAEYLYEHFPDSAEGEMALRLNTMVRKETCAEVARGLKLGDLMLSLAGSNSTNRGVFESQNVLGDACEAVLAAVYSDAGFDVARKFILAAWAPMLTADTIARKDPKSALQEWALGQGLAMPVYSEVSRQGPDHAPTFVMAVEIANSGKQTGTANSKRAAEQSAAAALLEAKGIEF